MHCFVLTLSFLLSVFPWSTLLHHTSIFVSFFHVETNVCCQIFLDVCPSTEVWSKCERTHPSINGILSPSSENLPKSHDYAGIVLPLKDGIRYGLYLHRFFYKLLQPLWVYMCRCNAVASWQFFLVLSITSYTISTYLFHNNPCILGATA